MDASKNKIKLKMFQCDDEVIKKTEQITETTSNSYFKKCSI